MQGTLQREPRSRVAERLRAWTRQGLDVVFSPECALCFAPVTDARDTLLCDECAAEFDCDPGNRCLRCANRLPDIGSSERCLDCQKRRPRFDSVLTLGTYRDAIRDAVLRMKQSGQEALALAVADRAWQNLGGRLLEFEADVLAPVPMHWRRRLARGVNGPELLAENLARRMRLPVARRLLIRRRNTLLQMDLTPSQRLQNMRRAFRASTGYHLDGACVLLIDDVLTTGATASEAARTLKRAGAGRVDVFVVGRTHGHA